MSLAIEGHTKQKDREIVELMKIVLHHHIFTYQHTANNNQIQLVKDRV